LLAHADSYLGIGGGKTEVALRPTVYATAKISRQVEVMESDLWFRITVVSAGVLTVVLVALVVFAK